MLLTFFIVRTEVMNGIVKIFLPLKERLVRSRVHPDVLERESDFTLPIVLHLAFSQVSLG